VLQGIEHKDLQGMQYRDVAVSAKGSG